MTKGAGEKPALFLVLAHAGRPHDGAIHMGENAHTNKNALGNPRAEGLKLLTRYRGDFIFTSFSWRRSSSRSSSRCRPSWLRSSSSDSP
jgi:hypothetical protein